MTTYVRAAGSWVQVAGTSGTVTPPAVTTAPTAVSNLALTYTSTSITASWTAATDPDGNLAGYQILLNGSTYGNIDLQTTTTLSNLLPGTTYTVGVRAFDAAGQYGPTATATTTTAGGAPPPPTGPIKYGPDGTSWPTSTPAWNATPNVVVSTWADLVTALKSATNGTVIHMHGGSYGTQTLSAITSLNNLTTNVLVRNVPGEVVTFTTLTSKAQHITWAGIHWTATFRIDQGADYNALARSRGHDDCNILVTSAHHAQVVEVVCLERPTSGGDRMQVKAYTGTNPPDGLVIDRSWLEGKDFDGGTGHVDTIQWTALAGVHQIKTSYIGMAGNNGTTQLKGEMQYNGVPYGTFEAYDSYFGGGENTGWVNAHLGQGNSTSQAGLDKRVRCVFSADPTVGDGRLLVNYGGCIIDSCQYTGLSVLNGITPPTVTNSEQIAPIAVPTFTTPPWWSEI